MAHANPEFALGLMRRDTGPVSAQARDLPTFGDLRARMNRIAYRLETGLPVSGPEERQLRAYHTGLRRIRDRARMEAATPSSEFGPASRGMHAGGKSGERFTEPKRRFPADVQSGRVKPRRGTLPQ